MRSIGLDVGGTNIYAVLNDENGNILHTLHRKTNFYDNDYMKNIVDMIRQLVDLSDEKLSGIGIGVPGIVNYDEGKVLACPALKWENYAVKDHLEQIFSLKTLVENDVNTWTLAERYLGAGTKCKNMAMITIGTGIGCGLLLNDKIYRGFSFEAGEVGYLPIGLEAYDSTCTYKDFGYFESNASASAASKLYFKITNRDADCEEVFRLAKCGDKNAEAVVEHIYKCLGIGISSLICVVNPEMIVIGGGMAREGEELINSLAGNVSRLIPLKSKICLSKLGDYGGAVGAALMVFNQ